MSAGSKTNSGLADADWRPGTTLDALRARAAMLAEIRGYFAARGVLEVETPLVASASATDPQLTSLTTRYTGPIHPEGANLYLQTSPEFAMKRLIAAGSGAIFQVCKAFRDGEAGRLHNPEFTMLEWYRPGIDLAGLADDVADLVRLGLQNPLPSVRQDYASLFAEHLDIDVFAAREDQLRAVAIARGVCGADKLKLDRDGWLDLLFSHLLQPRLGEGQLFFVTDYPASQAALARLNTDGRTAARFELFVDGVELANGYHELADAEEQAARFDADNSVRRNRGDACVPVDQRLLAALSSGMPDCSGVALGLDRLLMLRLGCRDIDEVLTFSLQRC